jgi:hypothetical protein
MRLWRFLIFAAALFATNASAASVCTTSTATSCTQVVNLGPAVVPGNGIGNGAAAFYLFGSIGAPAGSTLNSVVLEIVIQESDTALSVRNTGTNLMQHVSVADSAFFDVTDTASGADGSLLDAAFPNSFTLHRPSSTIANLSLPNIAASSTYTCDSSAPCSLPKTLTLDSGAISGTGSSYNGTGQFDLDYTVAGSASLSGSDPIHLRLNSITRTSGATATVTYNFTPEPGSIVLIGSGLWIVVRRRKKLLGL